MVMRMRQSGAAIGALYYKEPTTNVCRPMPMGTTGYSYGEYVDDAQFAPWLVEWVPVGTRLERMDIIADGARYPVGLFRDTQLQTQCSFNTYVQNACAPLSTVEQPVANAWGLKLFTSSSCAATSQVDYAIVDKFSTTNTCNPPQGQPRYAMKQDTAGNFEFYRIGTLMSGNFFVQYSGDMTCMPIPATSTVYSIGASVMGELVTGTEGQL